eukprot:2406724-Rhodomonas_salina.1
METKERDRGRDRDRQGERTGAYPGPGGMAEGTSLVGGGRLSGLRGRSDRVVIRGLPAHVIRQNSEHPLLENTLSVRTTSVRACRVRSARILR